MDSENSKIADHKTTSSILQKSECSKIFSGNSLRISDNGACPECGYTFFKYIKIEISSVVDTIVQCESCGTLYILHRDKMEKKHE